MFICIYFKISVQNLYYRTSWWTNHAGIVHSTSVSRLEHPRRVCVAGPGVGTRQFFGPPPRYYSKLHLSEMEMEFLKEDIRKEIKKKV